MNMPTHLFLRQTALMCVIGSVTGLCSGALIFSSLATSHPLPAAPDHHETTHMDFLFRIKDKPQVIDGDTVRVMLDLGFGIFKQVDVRLAAIDTPELNSKRERRAGQAAQAVAQRWVDAHWDEATRADWYVESIAKDKYDGRIVGDLQYGTTFLSRDLLHAGVARDYDGGKKVEWTAAELEQVERKAATYLAAK